MTALVLLALSAAAALFFTRHRQLAASHLEINQNDQALYTLKIDPNSATWQELALLPDIGEHKAKAIIAYREQNGPFANPASLKAVDGIGDKTLEKIASLLQFEGEQ